MPPDGQVGTLGVGCIPAAFLEPVGEDLGKVAVQDQAVLLKFNDIVVRDDIDIQVLRGTSPGDRRAETTSSA